MVTGDPQQRNRLPSCPFHLSFSYYRQCNLWLCTFGEMPLSFNFEIRMRSYVTVVKRPFTCTRLISPYYTKRQPNRNFKYTVDRVFGYRSQKFRDACAKSSTHAHSAEIRGGNSQGNGQFATDSQVYKRTLDGDPRTGMFHQTWPTVGNTTCSGKGV